MCRVSYRSLHAVHKLSYINYGRNKTIKQSQFSPRIYYFICILNTLFFNLQENAIGFTVIFTGGLFPICWVMGNLDSYSKWEEKALGTWSRRRKYQCLLFPEAFIIKTKIWKFITAGPSFYLEKPVCVIHERSKYWGFLY